MIPKNALSGTKERRERERELHACILIVNGHRGTWNMREARRDTSNEKEIPFLFAGCILLIPLPFVPLHSFPSSSSSVSSFEVSFASLSSSSFPLVVHVKWWSFLSSCLSFLSCLFEVHSLEFLIFNSRSECTQRGKRGRKRVRY